MVERVLSPIIPKILGLEKFGQIYKVLFDASQAEELVAFLFDNVPLEGFRLGAGGKHLYDPLSNDNPQTNP